MITPIHPEQSATSERRLLLKATATVGTVIGVASAIPFVGSLAPSERAMSEGGPVEVGLLSLASGAMASVAWRGKPVWILHRSPDMIASLRERTAMLADPFSTRSEQPDYARNPMRSIRPEYAVLVGICTHLGCVPNFKVHLDSGDVAASAGGFYCPCHGSKFDLAGRVYKNVPAPVNLVVPPYQFLTTNLLRIGD